LLPRTQPVGAAHRAEGGASSIMIGPSGPAVVQLPAVSHTCRVSVIAWASVLPVPTEVLNVNEASDALANPAGSAVAVQLIDTSPFCQPAGTEPQLIVGASNETRAGLGAGTVVQLPALSQTGAWLANAAAPSAVAGGTDVLKVNDPSSGDWRPLPPSPAEQVTVTFCETQTAGVGVQETSGGTSSTLMPSTGPAVAQF
jgi:hypothetical protein